MQNGYLNVGIWKERKERLRVFGVIASINGNKALSVFVMDGVMREGMDTATKRIAMQRIQTLFNLAKETFHEDPALAQRYVDLARKIAMAAKVRLPREYRRQVCRHCKSFILPGVNSRVRIKKRREPHMVITCLNCGKHMRIPLKAKKEQAS